MTMHAAPALTRRVGHGDAPNAALAFWRLLVLTAMFGMFLLLIMGRLTTLALFESTRAFGATTTDYIPPRGDIVDRNGVPLARSISGYAIRVTPSQILGDRKVLAKQLAGIFPDTTADAFYERLTSKTPIYLRKRALPEEVRRVHDLGEIAIEFPREAERLYPQHDLAAHVLGFINRDGHGALGMERELDKELVDPAKRGKPEVLALDARVQGALEAELASGMEATGAKGAAGVIMDVQTGEVVAMATLPSFNPNSPVFFNDKDQLGFAPAGMTPISRQMNSITNRFYELGSTFKPLTFAAALDAGVVRDLSVRYDATAPLEVAGFPIRDLHSAGRWLNVPEALVHSSNIVTARVADKLGEARLVAMMSALHFNERPVVDLAERAMPRWPAKWGRLRTMTAAYGHGIAVTPLHLASAYSALVNGGVWHPATMMKVAPGQKIAGTRVFTAATSARMRQLLRMIVVDGTGKAANAEGYRVGGKTGTAEKPSEGGYARNLVVSTFAAAFPMDNPRYVIIAMVDEPNAAAGLSRTAGTTAAPIVRNTVTRIGPLLGVIPDLKRDVDVSELMPLLWKPKGGE